MYVLTDKTRGFVGRFGTGVYYTNRLEEAQKFMFIEEAKRAQCGNELIETLDEVHRRLAKPCR